MTRPEDSGSRQEMLAAFALAILERHQDHPEDRSWCRCGTSVVLCEIRSLARQLGLIGARVTVTQ